MKIFINMPDIPRSRSGVDKITSTLPTHDRLEKYLEQLNGAVLPVTFRLGTSGATIQFDD